MSQPLPTVVTHTFSDRSVGLIVFGLLEVLLGLLACMMAPMMLVAAMIPQPGAPPMMSLMPAVVIYLVAGVVFIWLGVGSVLARRWARALWLVIGWMWLVVGVLSVAMMLLIWPDLQTQMATAAKRPIPPEALVVAQAFMFGCLGFIYVLLPGSLVLFYGSCQVKATCEARDPKERWTDRCPLPVLAVVLLLCGSLIGLVSAPAVNFVAPLFGVTLRGWQGAAVYAGFVAVQLLAAWGLYRLKSWAWWLTLAFLLLGIAAGVYNFLYLDFSTFFAELNLPKEQIDMVTKLWGGKMNVLMGFSAVFAVLYLGYMIYLRRYFGRVS